MLDRYIQLMNWIHRLCLAGAGICIIIITIIIPYGVFTRYVLNSAASWPEPLAILMMIWISFLSAIVCYRENLHIGVGILPAMLSAPSKRILGLLIEACMMVTNVFMFWWGIKLVNTTWYQSIAEFPVVSVGVSYLPVPIGGLLTSLFILERFLTLRFFEEPSDDAVSAISTE